MLLEPCLTHYGLNQHSKKLLIVVCLYIMKATTEDNTQSRELNADLQTKEKLKPSRPNIDHLIKKILTERRKQEKKNITLIIAILVIVSGIVLSSF